MKLLPRFLGGPPKPCKESVQRGVRANVPEVDGIPVQWPVLLRFRSDGACAPKDRQL